MRCFIAIELNSAIKKSLNDLKDATEKTVSLDYKAMRWIKPEHMHLTLKFLGEVDDDIVPPVCQLINKIASDTSRFDIEFGGLGFFPLRGPARVYWCGLKSGLEPLKNLQSIIDHSLTDLNISPEKQAWSPHLTLARINMAQTGKTIRRIPDSLFDNTCKKPLIQTVDSIMVFESELSRQGPVYTPLHQARLI